MSASRAPPAWLQAQLDHLAAAGFSHHALRAGCPGGAADRFRCETPFGGSHAAWEVLLNAALPAVAPDFVCVGDCALLLPAQRGEPAAAEFAELLRAWRPEEPGGLAALLGVLREDHRRRQRAAALAAPLPPEVVEDLATALEADSAAELSLSAKPAARTLSVLLTLPAPPSLVSLLAREGLDASAAGRLLVTWTLPAAASQAPHRQAWVRWSPSAASQLEPAAWRAPAWPPHSRLSTHLANLTASLSDAAAALLSPPPPPLSLAAFPPLGAAPSLLPASLPPAEEQSGGTLPPVWPSGPEEACGDDTAACAAFWEAFSAVLGPPLEEQGGRLAMYLLAVEEDAFPLLLEVTLPPHDFPNTPPALALSPLTAGSGPAGDSTPVPCAWLPAAGAQEQAAAVVDAAREVARRPAAVTKDSWTMPDEDHL